MNSIKKKLFIVVNVDWFFLSHRLPIALAAKEQGYDVTILTRNTGCFEELKNYNLKVIDIPFERSGTNILKELNVIRILTGIFRKERPDTIHNVAIKASIYGSIAARFAGIRNVIVAISGLGASFSGANITLLNRIQFALMKFAFSYEPIRFIHQNPDDFAMFKRLGFASDENSILIKGSGVNLDEFRFSELKKETGKVTIILVARMLTDKGVIEFKRASEILKHDYMGRIRWLLIGPVDELNPATIPKSDLNEMKVNGYFEWIGSKENIYKYYVLSDIVVLPSYREGMPKTLIEACAVGRPIVTTDTVGCRECVEEGINGYKVPVKDPDKLAQKIKKLIDNPEKRVEFGKNARLLAEKEFSLSKVIKSTLELYKVNG